MLQPLNLDFKYEEHLGLLIVTGQEESGQNGYFTIAAPDIERFFGIAEDVALRLGNNIPKDLETLLTPEKRILLSDLYLANNPGTLIMTYFNVNNGDIVILSEMEGIDRHPLEQPVSGLEEYRERSREIVAAYFFQYYIQKTLTN